MNKNIKSYKSFSKISRDFPFLLNRENGKQQIYLDSAASSQKPRQVIDHITNTYINNYANVHRGSYKLSQIATNLYENARDKIASFINAKSSNEIVFTRGATEGINLIATSWACENLKRGDEIILTRLEHHSNIIPWQIVCKKTGARIVEAIPDSDGNITIELFTLLVNDKTKLISISHVANSIGTIIPVEEICQIAKNRKIITVIDGCQAAPNISIDVQKIACDFYVFSGHKIYGPSGIGVMYGRSDLLERMIPYQTGGEMIETVFIDNATYTTIPHKFEAGTPNIVGAIGLGAAIEYVENIGIEIINAHSKELTMYGIESLLNLDGLKIIGNPYNRISIISFLYNNIHPNDLAMLLDARGFSLRSGHHCAQPAMRHFNVETTLRASVGIYNKKDDFDQLSSTLRLLKKKFI